MAVPSDQSILDALRTAYYEIVVNNAASYTTATGQTFTAHDLDKLSKGIAEYERRVARASRGMFAGIKFREAT